MYKYIVFALLSWFCTKAQNHDKACNLFNTINTTLQKNHFKPKPIDDSLSVYVFNSVLKGIDENHNLLLQEEYDALAVHKYKIDDYIKNCNCSFFDDFINIYKKALLRHTAIVKSLEKESLEFATNDTIKYALTAFPYKTDSIEAKNSLRRRMVHNILEDVAVLSKNKDSLFTYLPELCRISKIKICDSYLCRLDNYLNPTEGLDGALYNSFYTAFCNYFDPHTTYFNYDEKASFMSGVSSEEYSLGIYISQNEKEEIIIDEVIPGGPAYKTYKIDKGDQILKFASNDTEYVVSCSSIEAISDIIYSDIYKNVELTLRKKDGTIYSVALNKTIMKSDSHSVYSYILGDTNAIGYIKIPSFYSGFSTHANKGCAADVAAEVIQLKKKGIKGLIIDIQNNGGGVMEEAFNLAGMFINFGPLTVVSGGKENSNVYYDYNRGMLYDGPMVILVNGASASASEFFSGVLQDYNRAVVLGSTTMGKATMQTILPLEDTAENKDFVKVTIDKFYRVTGKSSQYNGIIPDVTVPELFEEFMYRESNLPTALKNDSINTVRFRKIKDNIIERVILQSRERIASDTSFNTIKSINKRISERYESGKAPLPITFDAVHKDIHSTDMLWSEISELTKKENSFSISSLPNSISSLPNDSDFYKTINEYKIKLLRTDLCVLEGIAILNDYIALKMQ